MADRYWVGGTGAWSGVNTLNWSAASAVKVTAICSGAGTNTLNITAIPSGTIVAGMTVFYGSASTLGTISFTGTGTGGTGTYSVSAGVSTASQDMSAATNGATVPTAADNVIFDANSNQGINAFTVTMSTTPRVCNDFTASGLTGAMTLAGTSIGLTLSGSLSLPASNFIRSYSGTTTFAATTTGKNITTNGVTLAATTFSGVGGGWTLGSAFSCTTNTLTFTNGTFDTSASNYSVTCGILTTLTGTKTIILNGSTVNCTVFTNSVPTGLTFSAGTSQINVTTASLFTGGAVTFYNVSFTATLTSSTSTMTGINVFNNLSFAARSTVGCNRFTFGANQTINGTLTFSAGTDATYRSSYETDIVGSARTLTVAAIASLTDIDFREITAAGAAGTWSGTRLGNCTGCTNITFDAGKTVYYASTGSSNWGGVSWSASLGGGADVTQFPLAQDTIVIPADTYPASGSTLTLNGDYNISSLDLSLRTTNTLTFATGTSSPRIVSGNWTTGTGITYSGTGTLTFNNRTGTQIITSAGRSFTQSITVDCLGTVQIADNFITGSTTATTVTRGTLNLNNFTWTTGVFASNNVNTRTLAFGTGKFIIKGSATAWSMAAVTNCTVTGTPLVDIDNATSSTTTVSTGALSETYSISFNFISGTYALTFMGGTTSVARNVNFTGFAGNVTFTGIIYGNLTLSTGMTLSATANALTFGGSSSTKTITSNGKTINQPVIFNGVGNCTWQPQDTMTVGTTLATSLVGGTLDLSVASLSTGLFSTSYFPLNTTSFLTRSIAFGSNNITLTSSVAGQNALDMAICTNFTCSGTGGFSSTMGVARTFTSGTVGGSTANAPNLFLTGGTAIATLTIGSWFNIVNFTGYSGTVATTTLNVAGLVLSTGGTFTGLTVRTVNTGSITSNGKTIAALDVGYGQPAVGTYSVSTLTPTLRGVSGTLLQGPPSGSGGTGTVDDGFWPLDLPFTVYYLGLPYTRIYVGTNQYITFGIGSLNYSGVGANNPYLPKIMVGAADKSVQRLYYEIIGTAPNRTFWLRSEGHTNSSGGIDGSPTLLYEAYFYENSPYAFDIQRGAGDAVSIICGAYSSSALLTSMPNTINTGSGFTYTAGSPAYPACTTTINDALTLSGTLTFSSGTLTTTSSNITAASFDASTATAKTLVMGSGTWTITGSGATAWNVTNPSFLTVTPGTSTILMSSASSKTFVGGSKTWGTLSQTGAGTLSITGSNTFNDLTASGSGLPSTILFTASTTTTFTEFTLSGTAGNLVTIGSVTAASHTLSKVSGIVSSNYLSISRSTATGGASWYAGATSVDGGNNSGWIFTNPGGPTYDPTRMLAFFFP